MPRRFIYLVVEGPQDVAFTGQILQTELRKLGKVRMRGDVDAFWTRFIPTTYPPTNKLGEEEFKPVPVPEFYQNETLSVAVEPAGGLNQVHTAVEDSLKSLKRLPDGVGILVDADEAAPIEVFNKLKMEIETYRRFSLGDLPGEVVKGPPRAGIYVLPDNENAGTLEDLLLDCGGGAYPVLKPLAQSYVDAVTSAASATPSVDYKEFNKPAGRKKALIGAMGSILRPGRAIQNTIRDDAWIGPATMSLPKIKSLSDFVESLLHFP